MFPRDMPHNFCFHVQPPNSFESFESLESGDSSEIPCDIPRNSLIIGEIGNDFYFLVGWFSGIPAKIKIYNST